MYNWIILSLLAPLFWASSNFIDKYILGKRARGIFDFLFFSSTTSWLFWIIALVFIGVPEFSAYSLIPILTGIILVYSYGFYAKALQQGDTSALVVLFKLIPVLALILGFIFLGQTLSLKEFSGFIVVFLGAIVVSFEKTSKIFIKGFGMILVAISMWAAMLLLVDFGLTKMPFWDYFLLDAFGSAVAGLTLFALPKARREIIAGLKTATAGKYAWFTGNNILDLCGQTIIKKALAIAPSVGLVTVVMQIQSFYAITIGVALTLILPGIIKEDISFATLSKKIIGALIMFLGVYILFI